jgi:hypothetical protein
MLSGCAHLFPQRDMGGLGSAIELTGVPYFPQEDHFCGPAALAEVLVAAGIHVTPDEVAPEVYLPGREGSLQTEMVAAVRQHERLGYVLRPSLADVIAEIHDGRPVLVLQNLGLDAAPVWHYAVVVGVDPVADRFTLRSGHERALHWSTAEFLAAWRDQRWAMVVVAADEIPASADLKVWLADAEAFESLHRPDLAAQAYAAATHRWPLEGLSWAALGNARYGLHDLPGARAALERATVLSPKDGAAFNNLAQVQAELGCLDDAHTSIKRALTLETDPDRRALYQRTADSIGTLPHPSHCTS